jgi:hypothetical protein
MLNAFKKRRKDPDPHKYLNGSGCGRPVKYQIRKM